MTTEFEVGTDEFTLLEVSEADAPQSVQAIYHDIRRLSGVPMVALIFRHIATYPEILEEVWKSIGPLFRKGRIQDAAWRVARSVSLTTAAPARTGCPRHTRFGGTRPRKSSKHARCLQQGKPGQLARHTQPFGAHPE